MADVKVVAPRNIGKGIIWNENTKQYEVNIGEGLEINNEGKVVVKKLITNPVTTKIVDNGTAQVIGEQYTIDYGNGLIEVNGILKFPLTTKTDKEAGTTTQPFGRFYSGCASTPTKYMGEDLYHKESAIVISAASLGMSKLLAINALACDLGGYRTETTWIVNKTLFANSFTLGVHTLASLEQDEISVMFQVKGIKA